MKGKGIRLHGFCSIAANPGIQQHLAQSKQDMGTQILNERNMKWGSRSTANIGILITSSSKIFKGAVAFSKSKSRFIIKDNRDWDQRPRDLV